jgi:hypothetical protein
MEVFWLLILSHFIADFPLQPGWLVRNKTKLWGLALHVSIHLAVMLILIGESRWVLAWPYLAAIAVTHFFIDAGKNLVWRWRPQWVAGPYLVDQFLHLLTIALVATWITRSLPASQLPAGSPWVVYAIGFLLATYVWYITEFVIFSYNESYHNEVVRTIWSRMLTRAIFLSVFIIFLSWVTPRLDISYAGMLFLPASVSLFLPYSADCYWKRALITDLAVSLACSFLIVLAAGSL